MFYIGMGFPRWYSGKQSDCQCRRCKRQSLDPWVRKLTWRRKWQPTPVFLPGESHGERSLAGHSPQGHKKTRLSLHACAYTHTHTHTHTQRNTKALSYNNYFSVGIGLVIWSEK